MVKMSTIPTTWHADQPLSSLLLLQSCSNHREDQGKRKEERGKRKEQRGTGNRDLEGQDRVVEEGATEAGISFAAISSKRRVRGLLLPLAFAKKVPDGMRQEETRLRKRRRRAKSGQGNAAVVAKAIAHRRETHYPPRTLHGNDVLARELDLVGCSQTAAPKDSSAHHRQSPSATP